MSIYTHDWEILGEDRIYLQPFEYAKVSGHKIEILYKPENEEYEA